MIHTDIIAFIGSTLTNTILELETETLLSYTELRKLFTIYPFWIIVWMVGEFLDLENLLFLLGMFDDLHPGVEFSTHYH